MKICFCGDIMPGGVLPYQEKYIDGELMTYLQSFDLRVGTLECGVGTNIPFDEKKMAQTMGVVFIRDEDLFRLKELDINVVTLANNHAFDLGLRGMENAVALLDKMGVKHCGAGHDIEEAKKPAVVEKDGKTYAFIGCMIDVPSPVMFHKASKTEFGVYQVSIDVLEKHIANIKRIYDYVFVLPHWGEEHSYYPPVYCKDCAKRMIDAGADAVIGSHPHIVNPVSSYRGKHIYYSLGNFLFPDKCMKVPRPMYYPETIEECNSLKRVWTFPYRIKENVVAVWHGRNRIGMVAEFDIKGKNRIKTKQRLTKLTKDNVLFGYHSNVFSLRFYILGCLMKLPRYSLVRRALSSRYNLAGRFLNKLNAFNIPVKAVEYE